MGVYLLEVNKHLFHPKEDNKELLGLEVHDQMYLTNYTWPDIAFLINLLTRYSSAPTQRHWNKVKHVLQ